MDSLCRLQPMPLISNGFIRANFTNPEIDAEYDHILPSSSLTSSLIFKH